MVAQLEKDGRDTKDSGRSAIVRADGITPAERLLKRLCDHSFLSMWNYSGIYRDQGRLNKKGDGKEVCDLLVVFENHIIIFSDKDCNFPNTGNPDLDWSRWYKKAVRKSAEQIWGAERWIMSRPELLFLDRKCSIPFPIDLPDPAVAKVHRIVVAHSVSERCSKEYGGTGSLMIVPSVVGEMHTLAKKDGGKRFTIGQIDSAKGYVHVLDDTSLIAVIKTLDTISDFIGYLEKKERAIATGKLGVAAGEDDLLAFYLKNVGPHGEHDFVVPPEFKTFGVDEGFWKIFQTRPERIAQIEANKISYAWDRLIENFSHHIFAGTSHYQSHPGLDQQERLFRLMAREPRTRRRLLARSLFEIINKTPSSVRATRLVLPSKPGDPHYLFLLLPEIIEESYEKYRELRRVLLGDYCAITKLDFPEAERIIGIATESGRGEAGSEDFLLYDATNWTEQEQEAALQTRAEMIELGLLGERKRTEGVEKEFPDVPANSQQRSRMAFAIKGRNRNEPCPCGSGKKVKKCHGRA
jgi:hypothetical protein